MGRQVNVLNNGQLTWCEPETHSSRRRLPRAAVCQPCCPHPAASYLHLCSWNTPWPPSWVSLCSSWFPSEGHAHHVRKLWCALKGNAERNRRAVYFLQSLLQIMEKSYLQFPQVLDVFSHWILLNDTTGYHSIQYVLCCICTIQIISNTDFLLSGIVCSCPKTLEAISSSD